MNFFWLMLFVSNPIFAFIASMGWMGEEARGYADEFLPVFMAGMAILLLLVFVIVVIIGLSSR